MPAINLNRERRRWLRREHDTWRLVRSSFATYIYGTETTADKLRALCSLTWITKGGDNTRKVTLPALRTLAERDVDDCDFGNLAYSLKKARFAPAMVEAAKSSTGFVNFYNPYRNSCLNWFDQQSTRIYDILERAYLVGSDEDAREIYRETNSLNRVAHKGATGGLHPENILTPLIACLDPRKRCPVINGRDEVQQKLKSIGVKKNSLPDQFWALVKLIHHGGIADAFMLDVITPEQLSAMSRSRPSTKSQIRSPIKEGELAEKDENEVEVLRKANQSSYIRVHNWMTNRLRVLCEASGRTVTDGRDKGCRFDALVKNYDGEDRDLLIEAKSSTDIAFCRMAIGQLLDYRRQLPGSATTDLAVLFSDEPNRHVLDFLGHVGVKALWLIDDRIVDSSGSTLFMSH